MLCGRRWSRPGPIRRRLRTSSRTSSWRRGSIRRRVDAAELARLVSARAEIPRAAFDAALAHVGDEGFRAAPHLEQKVVSDAGELDPVIERVIAANPGQADQYRNGKQGLLGFFVGQVMKETGGVGRSARGQRARAREAEVINANPPRRRACPGTSRPWSLRPRRRSAAEAACRRSPAAPRPSCRTCS